MPSAGCVQRHPLHPFTQNGRVFIQISINLNFMNLIFCDMEEQQLFFNRKYRQQKNCGHCTMFVLYQGSVSSSVSLTWINWGPTAHTKRAILTIWRACIQDICNTVLYACLSIPVPCVRPASTWLHSRLFIRTQSKACILDYGQNPEKSSTLLRNNFNCLEWL